MIKLPLAHVQAPSRTERGERSAAFGLLPPELAEHGAGSAAQPLFVQLQRPWLWDAAGPAIGRSRRQQLAPMGLEPPTIVTRRVSRDGSTKLLLQLGADRVEAVHMPRTVRTQRVTLCISSQVGCAMGCTFCATASMGFQRQLTAGEIVSQVLVALFALGPRHPHELTLVFMGMGEPLHNLSEVARAVEVLCTPAGLGLAPGRITVSTSGLLPELARFGRLAKRPLLAVSLNATTDEQRRALMPVNRRYPLAALRAALQDYPLRRRERITVEYVLLAGVNDSSADAARLADYCAAFPSVINLIPFNEHARSPFRAPSEEAIDAFVRALLARRPCLLTVRRSRGKDVQAACGQLLVDTSARSSG